jgi:hypothetical protein
MAGIDQANRHANVVADPITAQGGPKGQPPLIFGLSVIFAAILRKQTRTASNISASLLDHADPR